MQCRYCQIIRDPSRITFSTASEAISCFLSSSPFKNNVIKLFGGEPLLEFPLIVQIIDLAKKKAKSLGKNIIFQIVTNATLLDKEKMFFFQKQKNLELRISLDGAAQTHNINRGRGLVDRLILKHKQVIVHMVVAPNQVSNFFDNFRYLVKEGVKKFNLLPAYFIRWHLRQRNILKEQFSLIAEFIHQNKKDNIYIENVDVLSSTPLFNHGFVVDCNGDVFKHNAFLFQPLASFRKEMKVGEINDGFLKVNKIQPEINLQELMQKYLSSEVLDSTYQVDSLLSDFVRSIKNETVGYKSRI